MRGKTKIGISAFLSTMLLASMIATLGVPTVLAQTTATLKAPNIVNPLLNPGDTIVVNLLVDDVANLWSLEFTLTFDTNLLTPTGYFFETGTAQFRNTFVADLNDAAGYVHLGATRPDFGGRGVDFLGVGDGATTNYPLTNGVIQAGSESAFYKVTGEFLGTAQTWLNPNTGLVEQRDPGPWMGGGGDGKVDRMPIIPSSSMSGGVERVYQTNPSTGVRSLLGTAAEPRWQVDYATGAVKSNQIYEYRSRWPVTGRIMTMDYATGDGVPAVASVDYALSGGVGSVTFATPPALGENVYMQYNYRTGLTTSDTLLVAAILFTVEGRGTCPLTISSSTMLDQYIPANTITHTAVDGVFDNRKQGTMSAPQIVDTSLIPGSEFDVYVSVGPWMGRDVEKLWGWQFVMDFDPNVLMAVDYETLGIFAFGAGDGSAGPGPSELAVDYAAISGHSWYGDPVGLTTSTPVEVVRIHFVVVGTGVTLLTLHDTALADVDGANMVHDVYSGSFANTENISVSVNSIFLESRKWSASKDGTSYTLTAQVTNTGVGITKAGAHFVVYDSLGVVVAEVITADYDIMPGTTVRIAGILNVGPLPKPGSYVVEGTVWYIDYLGNMVEGKKGSPTGARSTMVKTFTLYP